MTFGEKGCRNANRDFDKLFFISTEYALHLCLGLMKEERAVLLAKRRAPRACPVRVCSCIQASRPVFQFCATEGILCFSFRLPTNEENLLSQHGETKGKHQITEEKTNNKDGSL